MQLSYIQHVNKTAAAGDKYNKLAPPICYADNVPSAVKVIETHAHLSHFIIHKLLALYITASNLKIMNPLIRDK